MATAGRSATKAHSNKRSQTDRHTCTHFAEDERAQNLNEKAAVIPAKRYALIYTPIAKYAYIYPIAYEACESGRSSDRMSVCELFYVLKQIFATRHLCVCVGPGGAAGSLLSFLFTQYGLLHPRIGSVVWGTEGLRSHNSYEFAILGLHPLNVVTKKQSVRRRLLLSIVVAANDSDRTSKSSAQLRKACSSSWTRATCKQFTLFMLR